MVPTVVRPYLQMQFWMTVYLYMGIIDILYPTYNKVLHIPENICRTELTNNAHTVVSLGLYYVYVQGRLGVL